MSILYSKLSTIKHLLEKALTLPSPKPPKAPSADASISIDAPKEPSLTPGSKKDPMKQAQQMEDPDKKAAAIKEAKGARAKAVTLSKNGQWSL